MKKIIFPAFLIGAMCLGFAASAQTMTPATPITPAKVKKPRPSLPDTVKGTTKNGVDIVVAYSQPGVKGRTVGKEIAPFDGKPWRTGANEETTISFSKDVKLEGKEVPAGKYSLWSIPGEKEWVIIINKKTTEWGTVYSDAFDVLRVTVKTQKAPAFTELLKFSVGKDDVSFAWGDYMVAFKVK
ncbi:DUF2911 domain-containing protein [Mucilaginibacter sp. HMF5004]|uniref:DUF2911 domain-containing protein n=1 Tax=Mucilaginibacter rivuli TaxID=2857527 RepID=UPI001C5D27FB|nr:DUF2911 domain-containing protein [Mucilaginibacter rivuli]MBW4891357.1 DUF2911 domain-containing protein [Mucilaginibacter rivuli]